MRVRQYTFESVNNETVCQAVLDGMELEYVYSPTALEATVAWNPERVMEAIIRENCSVFVHDEDRCGPGIVDDRVDICCLGAETRALTAVIDTGAPDAREWAVSVFERCRREAKPVEPDAFDALLSSGLTDTDSSGRGPDFSAPISSSSYPRIHSWNPVNQFRYSVAWIRKRLSRGEIFHQSSTSLRRT